MSGIRKDTILQNPGFIWLWSGETVSTISSSVGTMAITWLIYDLTQSEAAMSGIWLSYLLPSLFVQIVAGPYLDRWDRKKILVFSQMSRALLFLVLLLLTITSQVTAWELYLASCINGMIQPLYMPSSLAALPMIVSKEQLPQANAYMDGTSRLMMFLGPPVGGLLVASGGILTALVAVVSTYTISSLLLTRLPLADSRDQVSKESWWSQFILGYRYFFGQRELFWLGVFIASIQFGVGVTMAIHLPYIVSVLGGDSFSYGLFIAGYPFGYFIGTLLFSRFRKTNRTSRLMLGSFLFGGTTFVALGLVQHLWLAILIEIVAGLAAPFFHVHSTSLFQITVPKHLLGRILSVRLFIIRCTMPLGVVVGGVFAEIWGIRPLFALIGGIICLLGILGLTLPFFRFLREQ
ncbi:MFS transporter [Brevibacillus sp. SYSU BS000544]|uniref:MFS transporter n=1 Tax=Brevibacillus sp. SYSU BS000544 TaxID=3416443 RepID=UPI003CE45991